MILGETGDKNETLNQIIQYLLFSTYERHFMRIETYKNDQT